MVDPATKLVVLVAIHFMILFTAFSAFQTIATKIHQDEGDRALGPFRFGINYFFFMISNLFVSKVKYSQKWQITFATLTYVAHYLSGFFATGTSTQVKYIAAGLGAAINGIGASFLWTSVGSYIHKVCHIYNKLPEKGHYYGMFTTIYSVSSILGAIIITFGLSLFQPNIYFTMVSGVAFLAFLFGLFFITDLQKLKKDSLLSQQQQPQPNSQNQLTFFESAKQSAISTLKYYPIMKFTLGLIVLDGMNIGVSTGTMLHLMPTTDDKKQNNFNAGICLMMFGAGSIFGGYLGGKICDKLRIKLSSSIGLYLFLISCLFSIAAQQLKQMWAARLSCFIWGFILYYISSNLMVICSRLYGGTSQSFALTKQFHSFAFVVYQVVAMCTNNQLPVRYIMMVLIVLAIPALWGICKSPEQKKSEINSIIESQNQQKQQKLIQNQ